MSQDTQVLLKTSALRHVHLNSYPQDFTFIVNGEEFHTSRLVSDLLSPTISGMHASDPTYSSYALNNTERGDFSRILSLATLQPQQIPGDELPFVAEVAGLLQNAPIGLVQPPRKGDVTVDNVIGLVARNTRFGLFYGQQIDEELDFIAEHFFELLESQRAGLKGLGADTLQRVLSSDRLKLKNENQLIGFVNECFAEDENFAVLYELVLFEFVGKLEIGEFVDAFGVNHITGGVWRAVSRRLRRRLDEGSNAEALATAESRYRRVRRQFVYGNDGRFDGIINFLRQKSKGDIESLVSITSTKLNHPSQAQCNICKYESDSDVFCTADQPNSWICFDFKEHRVSPTSYIIKSYSSGQNGHHPRSWVLEGSNDGSSWQQLDRQPDCPHLNNKCITHSFGIGRKNRGEFRYIRMRQTDKNWAKGKKQSKIYNMVKKVYIRCKFLHLS